MCDLFEMFMLITFNTFSEVSIADLLDEQVLLPSVHALCEQLQHAHQLRLVNCLTYSALFATHRKGIETRVAPRTLAVPRMCIHCCRYH